MYSRGRQKLMSAVGGVPRRQLLQGAGVLGLTAVLSPTAVFGHNDDDDERLGPFGPWSTPVSLGPVVNSSVDDYFPAISKDGLSLCVTSKRPGGVNRDNPGNVEEIWVSKRARLDAPWQKPVNLDAFNRVPVINSIGSIGSGVGGHNTSAPDLSPDGHLMFFHSPRPNPSGCGASDLYVSHRNNKHNDFGWQQPVNLGCTINGPDFDNAPTYFEDEETGIISMYFASNRPGGPPGAGPAVFTST
jgi:hypothetical protein